MSEYVDQIAERGWISTPFAQGEADRARYAELANQVISTALDSEVLRDAFTFELVPGIEQGTVRSGMYGISAARNSVDEKVSLHVGHLSRFRVDAVIPERKQPAIYSAFWEANSQTLEDIEGSMKLALHQLGANALDGVIFPPNIYDCNVHIRTVRYNGAVQKEPGAEVVAGHADLGIATLHLYETHGGWLRGVPFARGILREDDSEERRACVRTMRNNLTAIEPDNMNAAFFLGASWDTALPEDTGSGLRDLPAYYHAGFRPEYEAGTVSVYADQVTEGTRDRVSVIVFSNSNAQIMRNGTYRLATVNQCRPNYQA